MVSSRKLESVVYGVCLGAQIMPFGVVLGKRKTKPKIAHFQTEKVARVG
jgi:hypothetical protein